MKAKGNFCATFKETLFEIREVSTFEMLFSALLSGDMRVISCYLLLGK